MDGPEALTRLAQKVRARLEVTEAEMDNLGIAMTYPGGLEAYRENRDMLNTLMVRFDALTEVLELIERERRGQ